MIKPVTLYDVICDRCGDSLASHDECYYNDEDCAEFVANESEWHNIGGKHYCPDCVVFDEDIDDYRPKPK